MSKPRSKPIFRPAAVEAHGGGERPGRPLEIVPLWTRLAELVTAVAVVAALIFAATVEIGEYAEAVAVVHREGRMLVTAPTSGTVASVEVEAGWRIDAGAVLIRLDDVAERTAHTHAEQIYERQLIEVLRDPGDAAARERLALADAALREAEASLRERTIVAPEAGLVSDVRVRRGQGVTDGDAVMAIEQDTAKTMVIGLFPGHLRPLISPADTRMFLELEGFADSRQEVRVRAVDDEIVGPAEAMRLLGHEQQGAFELRGPIVVVETELSSDRFRSNETEYRVYDGMQGTLEVELRSATLLEILVDTFSEGR